MAGKDDGGVKRVAEVEMILRHVSERGSVEGRAVRTFGFVMRKHCAICSARGAVELQG